MRKEISEVNTEYYLDRLDQARKDLRETRAIFIVSTLGILANLGQGKKNLKNACFWFGVWSIAFESQKQLSKENIAEAKIALKLPRTNKMVEKKIIDVFRKTSELLGIDPQFGEGTTLFHIQLTKTYQKNMGVKDRASLYADFQNRTNKGSKMKLNQITQ